MSQKIAITSLKLETYANRTRKNYTFYNERNRKVYGRSAELDDLLNGQVRILHLFLLHFERRKAP